jgi:hypothetical protein
MGKRMRHHKHHEDEKKLYPHRHFDYIIPEKSSVDPGIDAARGS